MSDLIGAAAAAEILNTSTRTVHRLTVLGDLPPAQKMPGGTGAYLYRRSVVERLATKRAAA